MSKALAEVASPVFLNDAWRRLYTQSRVRSRDGFGVDGESINRFKEKENNNISVLSAQVRKGEYQFSALTAYLVPKPRKTDVRVICVPTVRDRIVQRALLDFLTDKYMVGKKAAKLANPISFGFIKHRTVKAAVGLACSLRAQHPWVYKTDITAFFDRVKREDLRASIKRHVTEKSLHPLLLAAMDCEVDDAKTSVMKALKRKKIKKGRGVRQGMPLSPLFANLLMVEFDRAVRKKKIKAVRYADDLIFFGSSMAQCMEYHEFCKQRLAKLELEVPEPGENSKTQVFEPQQMADFLGVGIALIGTGYYPVVTEDQLARIRDRFLALGQISELVKRRITLSTLGGVLDSTVEGYLNTYQFCHNESEVLNRLSDFRDKAVKTLFKDGLKVDLGKLGSDARLFLGI